MGVLIRNTKVVGEKARVSRGREVTRHLERLFESLKLAVAVSLNDLQLLIADRLVVPQEFRLSSYYLLG